MIATKFIYTEWPIRKISCLLIGCWIFWFFPSLVWSKDLLQVKQWKAVDSLFTEFDSGTPGAAVGIYQDGIPIYEKGYGMARLESASPIMPSTIFRIASVSKQFTAFAVLLLAYEGKLNLDDDIRSYLPYVPDFGRKMSIRHLVFHTSGFRDYDSLLHFSGLSGSSIITQNSALELIKHQNTINFNPGSEFAYNNTGYVLLAEVVKTVSGESLREFADKRIFKPLQMHHTKFSDDMLEVVGGTADSYALNDSGKWGRGILNQESVGATGVRTTIQDMAKWVNNFTHARVGGEILLNEFIQPGRLDDGVPIAYGFGLYRMNWLGRDALMHTGSEGKFTSIFVHFPKENFSIVILANTPAKGLHRAREISEIYLGKDVEPSISSFAVPEKIARPTKQVEKFSGLFAFEDHLLRLEYRAEVLFLVQSGKEAEVIFRADETLDIGDENRFHGDFYIPSFDSNGVVIELKAGKPADTGQHLRYRRVESIDPEKIDLNPYVGRYWSSELDASFFVYLEGGRLLARSLRSSKSIALAPMYLDAFSGGSWMFSHVFFEKIHGSNANAMLLTNRRARNVRFERVP